MLQKGGAFMRRKTARTVFPLIAALSIAGWFLPAGATTLVQLGTLDMLNLADLVAVGRVSATECYLHPDGGFPMTRILVQVKLPLKGASEASLLIEELGGQVGSLIGEVPGAPEYKPGEEVLVFLQDMGNGTYRTYGMFQGKFTVVTDAVGERYLVNQRPDAMLMDQHRIQHVCPPLADGRFPYVPFVEGIRARVGE
jgi:hypothetical protein